VYQDARHQAGHDEEEAEPLFDEVDGPCSRHRCAKTWSLVNATRRGAAHG
jgi:hypothetical protein